MSAHLEVPAVLRERVAAVLRDAAAVVESQGWTQGDYCDREAGGPDLPAESCPVCALGAIGVAAVGEPEIGQFLDAPDIVLDDDAVLDGACEAELSAVWAASVLAAAVDPDRPVVAAVSGWNDDEDRAAAEVAAVLRQTADTVVGGGS